MKFRIQKAFSTPQIPPGGAHALEFDAPKGYAPSNLTVAAEDAPHVSVDPRLERDGQRFRIFVSNIDQVPHAFHGVMYFERVAVPE